MTSSEIPAGRRTPVIVSAGYPRVEIPRPACSTSTGGLLLSAALADVRWPIAAQVSACTTARKMVPANISSASRADVGAAARVATIPISSVKLPRASRSTRVPKFGGVTVSAMRAPSRSSTRQTLSFWRRQNGSSTLGCPVGGWTKIRQQTRSSASACLFKGRSPQNFHAGSGPSIKTIKSGLWGARRSPSGACRTTAKPS